MKTLVFSIVIVMCIMVAFGAVAGYNALGSFFSVTGALPF